MRGEKKNYETSTKRRNRRKKNQAANAVGNEIENEAGETEESEMPGGCNISIKDIQMAMEVFNMQQKPAKTQEEALQKPYQFWSTQPVPKMGN